MLTLLHFEFIETRSVIEFYIGPYSIRMYVHTCVSVCTAFEYENLYRPALNKTHNYICTYVHQCDGFPDDLSLVCNASLLKHLVVWQIEYEWNGKNEVKCQGGRNRTDKPAFVNAFGITRFKSTKIRQTWFETNTLLGFYEYFSTATSHECAQVECTWACSLVQWFPR